MILELSEVKTFLRLDMEYFDEILIPLIEAIPSYLEIKTGRTWLDSPVHPLAKTTAKFLMQLWFENPLNDTADRLKRTIESLCGTLTALGRDMD